MPDDTAVAIETPVAVETPAVETPAIEAGVESAVQPGAEQGEQPAEGAEGEIATQDPAIDPSGASAAIKKAIDTLKATDPAAARMVRDLYHQQQAFKHEFPGGLKEVQQLKQTLDTVGGAEGLQSLTAEKSEWDGIDQKFAAGDASVLDTFIANSPEGFVKLAPAILTALNKQSPETYNHVMSGIFTATLDSWKFSDTLAQMFDSLAQILDGDGKQLCGPQLQQLQTLYKQYEGIKELGSKAPVKKVEPEREALEKDKKAFQAEKQSAVRNEINTETQKYAGAKYDILIAAEAKLGVGIPEKGTRSYDNMLVEIDREVAREIGKDKAVLKKLNALDATGKKGDMVAYLNAQFDKVAPKIVQRIAKEWMSTKNPGGAKAKLKAEATDAGNAVHLNQVPERDSIDWSRTAKTDPMNRRAYLKGRPALYTW